MKSLTLNNETLLFKEGYSFVLGIDEAGRGPWAGPVVAAAVLVQRTTEHKSNRTKSRKLNTCVVRDSKKLSIKQREQAFQFIMDNFAVGIGIISHKEIDNIGLTKAVCLAMEKAVKFLIKDIGLHLHNHNNPKTPNNSIVLIDGRCKINKKFNQKSIIRGDDKFFSIAAASIIAKVTRDNLMVNYNKKYPQYSFDKHKGYGTKLHYEMIRKHGVCRIHRKSFEPIKNQL